MASTVRLLHGLLGLVALGSTLMPAPAAAQGATGIPRPLKGHAIEAHGLFVPFGRNQELATERGFPPKLQPRIAIGAGVGAHYYLFSVGVLTVGVGGRLIAASRTVAPTPDDATDMESSSSKRLRLRKRLTVMASELSLNFGGADGWSYLSGGIGRARLSLVEPASNPGTAQSTHTAHAGGGARWHTTRRTAFSLDLRFYTLRPLPGTATDPALPRMTVMVLSIGAAFR